MANEFVAKNGLISQNNSVVTGSFIVTNGITGSLQGNANTSTTASYAVTASYALNGGGGGGGSTPVKLTSQTLASGSWAPSGSYYLYSWSNSNVTTNCDVDVTPQNSSYLTAYNAQVLPYVGVATGVATLYSQFPPSANMVVDIVITQTI